MFAIVNVYLCSHRWNKQLRITMVKTGKAK